MAKLNPTITLVDIVGALRWKRRAEELWGFLDDFAPMVGLTVCDGCNRARCIQPQKAGCIDKEHAKIYDAIMRARMILAK